MSSPIAVGRTIDGKYRVDKVIGEGGFGVVVCAYDLSQQRWVAIKVLLDGADPVMAERFRREAQATAGIASERVTKIYDVGQLDGAPYMVMELLDGADLDAIVVQHGPLSIADACDFVIQACEPLALAHALGFVHRDIKPSNLFLTHRFDGTPFIKLLDFGISKHSLEQAPAIGPLTATGAVLGSPHFMSPEQLVSSRDVDLRTDIWSLGASLHELLAGGVPFDGVTLADVLAGVLRDDPPPLRQLRPDVPPAVEATVLRCLQKDALERFPSVAELADALAPHASPRAQPVMGLIHGHVSSAAQTVRGASLQPPPTVAVRRKVPTEMFETPPLGSGVVHPAHPAPQPHPSDPGQRAHPPAMSPLGPVVPTPPIAPVVPQHRSRRTGIIALVAAFAVVLIGLSAAAGWYLGIADEPDDTPSSNKDRERPARDKGDEHLRSKQVDELVSTLDRAQASVDSHDYDAALKLGDEVNRKLIAYGVQTPSRIGSRAGMVAMSAGIPLAEARVRTLHPGEPRFVSEFSESLIPLMGRVRVAQMQMLTFGRYPFAVCAQVRYAEYERELARALFRHAERETGSYRKMVSDQAKGALSASQAAYRLALVWPPKKASCRSGSVDTIKEIEDEIKRADKLWP